MLYTEKNLIKCSVSHCRNPLFHAYIVSSMSWSWTLGANSILYAWSISFSAVTTHDLSCTSTAYVIPACFPSNTVTVELKKSLLSPDAQRSVSWLVLHSSDSWQDNILFQKFSLSHNHILLLLLYYYHYYHYSCWATTTVSTSTSISVVATRTSETHFPWASRFPSLWLQVKAPIALGDPEFSTCKVMRCLI